MLQEPLPDVPKRLPKGPRSPKTGPKRAQRKPNIDPRSALGGHKETQKRSTTASPRRGVPGDAVRRRTRRPDRSREIARSPKTGPNNAQAAP